MTFENSTARLDEGKPQLEIAVKTINLWTGAPSVSIGNAILESDRSSIMNVQVNFSSFSIMSYTHNQKLN